MKISARSDIRAVALVIVLSLVALLTIIAIAFFSQVGTESKAARSYADSMTTKQLAETAVGIVMSQIREATTTPNAAWGSQPGLIRVFGEVDGGTGKASSKVAALYKLYSSNEMVVPASGVKNYNPDKEIPVGASGWNHQPALFTDINEPVYQASSLGNANKVLRYPVADPKIAKDKLVEGFSIDLPDTRGVAGFGDDSGREARMPVRWLYVLKDGAVTAPEGVSADGKTVTWSSKGGNAASAVPRKDNPIVGRVAFWTDDDSTKININTAGGDTDDIPSPYTRERFAGSYWDTPHFTSGFDAGMTNGKGAVISGGGGLANCQPAQHEYQRYPGHPATTSLGMVFGKLLTSEQIFQLTPRITPSTPVGVSPVSGSLGGTRRSRGFALKGGVLGEDEGALDIKTDRLYATVDELCFSDAKRNGGKRVTNDTDLATNPAVLTPETMDRLRFFLTAHSRSPELNLYGRPRVTVWPIWGGKTGATSDAQYESTTGGTLSASNMRTAYDKLIYFCSTIGGRPEPKISNTTEPAGKSFAFVRRNPYTATGGLSDLESSVDIMGRSTKQNLHLMQYLYRLTSEPIPGYGVSFAQKYAAGTDNRSQILAEIYDYIRSTNLKDRNKGNSKPNPRYAPMGIVTPTIIQQGKLGPAQPRVKGFGRFPTISEATLVFYYAGPRAKDSSGKVTEGLMRAFLMFSTFDPMMGYAPFDNLAGRVWFKVDFDDGAIGGAPAWSVNVQPAAGASRDMSLGFASNIKRLQSLSAGWGGRNFGGYEGFLHTLIPPNVVSPPIVQPTPYQIFPAVATFPPADRYPFQTYFENAIPVKAQTDGIGITSLAPFRFNGGKLKLTIQFKDPNRSSAAPPDDIQTMTLIFPPSDATTLWPGPTSALWNDEGNFKDTWSMFQGKVDRAYDLDWRIDWARRSSYSTPFTALAPAPETNQKFGNRWRSIVQPGDVVRSLIPAGDPTADGSTDNKPTLAGDLRLTALYSEDGAGNRIAPFAPHPDYQSSVYHAQFLRNADGSRYYPDAETTYGNIVKLPGTSVYPRGKAGFIPPKVNGVTRADGDPGDFDTGIGSFADGPYVNKPDEGNFVYRYWDDYIQDWRYPIPYFGTEAYEPPGDSYFSPNRQIPSAGMFGSLPTRALSGSFGMPWETLCLSPFPSGSRHYGLKNGAGNSTKLADHLLLDLFHMPVVEPYAISEPFSTAGKINLNQEIVPFRWIHRTTGLRAALQPLRITAVEAENFNIYKSLDVKDSNESRLKINYRYRVDRDQTMKSIEFFYNDTRRLGFEYGFFKSPTEICERYLYPEITSGGAKPTFIPGDTRIIEWWRGAGGAGGKTLTGDNMREKPYVDLLERVTTKSNTYTVHIRVQSLRQPPGQKDADYLEWKERPESIVSEYRGETTIERYLDPDDERLKGLNPKIDPDNLEYFDDPKKRAEHSLENVYRFRIVNSKRFMP